MYGLVQEKRNSSPLAMELNFSCTNPFRTMNRFFYNKDWLTYSCSNKIASYGDFCEVRFLFTEGIFYRYQEIYTATIITLTHWSLVMSYGDKDQSQD